MFSAAQSQCSACGKAVVSQSVQRCKNCNEGYCEDCFKKRNGLDESKAEKTEGQCIPCKNTILIVKLEIEDKKNSLPSRNTSSQSEQSQSFSAAARKQTVSSGYSQLDSYDEENDDDFYEDDDFDTYSQQMKGKQRTASKKKDRACPIYRDRNGKRVPFALILAGVVSEYDRDPPLTGKSTGLKGSTKLSSGFSVPKNKNAGTKKNAQLVEEKGSKNQFVPDGKSQSLKEGGSSGQSNEILEVSNANMPHTADISTYNEPINKPLADVQRAQIQQREKSGKGHSVNVQDFYHSSSDHQEASGSQHGPPVAMILAGLAGEKFQQEALHSRIKFMGGASQQFSNVSRFQESSTGRDDIVASRQKSQNKNLVLTRSSSLVKDSLTENFGQDSTESGALHGTTMPAATEDTKQSQSSSSCTIADMTKLSLTFKLQGSFAKIPVKRKVSEEDTEDQKRAITGDVVTNSVLSLANSQTTNKTYEKQEKLRTSKQDSETSETKGLESSHVLVERSMVNVNEGMKQDNHKKTKSLEYDKDKAEPKQSVKTSFVATYDNKDTSQIRSVGSVPAKTIESSTTSEESDSDDDVVPYALRMADISREPHRKKKKEKLRSDKPFALQLPTVNKNPPREAYTLFRFLYTSMKQDNEKGTNLSAKSDYREGSDSEYCIFISPRSSGPTLTELDTVENELKSAKGGTNVSSEKTGHKNIINKNMNQASSIKIAIPEPVHKTTQNVLDSGLEESKKSRNSHVEFEQEELMNEDEGTKEKPKSETDASEKPGNDNTLNGNMEVMVLNPANKGPSEAEAEISNDDSEAASTLVNSDASISERNSDKEDSLEENNKSDNETIANSENNPQMVTVTRKEENDSLDENGTVTLLAETINDKLQTPQPDVQFETSSAVGISDEVIPSVMDRFQLTTSLEEDVKQTPKRAKLENSTQDENSKKEEVDDSKSQFHIESVAPSQPSGTMKNSYLLQSSGDKEKEGHSSKNAAKQEVKTLEPNSAKNQQSKTDELFDPSNVCDIDHSEIHHAFKNIGRKTARRSTLCCIGCGRPECQSNVMQSMLLMNQVAKKNGLQVWDVNPDGNCMFTAVVDQLLSQADQRFDALSLRQNAVIWLKNNPCSKDGTHYSSFLDSESWEEYLLRLSQETQWGDHIILRAIAEFLKHTIEVLTPQKSSETFHVTKIEPEFNKPLQDEKSLLLGHVGESHYVSLRPKDPTGIEPMENEKAHVTEELEQIVIDIEKQKDEERENTQHVSPDCREKVQIFEETYIDTWSDCPGIHLSFALKTTFSPATVLQEANSVSSEMVSLESDTQSYYLGNTFHQGKYVKIYVGSVIEGLYSPDLDKPNECGLSYDWGEVTEIFVRQDLQVIQKNDQSEVMNNLYMEEDPAHPGFVRLLSASLSIQQAYGADIPGSSKKYISNNSFKSPKHSSYFPLSVKYKKINTRDIVGIRCLYWPTSAEKWASRKRFEGWPAESIIYDIVNEGCLILPVPNMKSQNPEVVFQISFALAEKKLAQIAVSNEQRYCYIIWKAICNQVFKGKNLLEAIYYKTVFFFACETVPAEHWRNHPGPCIFFMLDELLKCIRERNLPNYFLPRNNLLDATDAEKLKDAEEILRNLRSNILLYVRLLMENTWKQTEILEKVIDNIQTFKIFQSARLTTLELFVPETIELAKESVRSFNYKEGYERLTQAYEDRLAVCTCDDQMPINLFIHGAISNVGITATTWFLLYCDEHFKGQLASSLMQEMSLYDGQELIKIGHILPADISGKYVDSQVPKVIARDVCSFSCQFAKYLNHIGSSNHALQVLYYCIHRHKEQEEKAPQSVLTGEEYKQMNGKEHNDRVNDFSDYNMLDVYTTLHRVYSSRNEIQLLRQHLTDVVQLVEKIGSSSAYHSLSYMLGDLGDKEGKEKAYIKYQELQQVEAEVRKEIEASEKSYKFIVGITVR
ncbi:hypothetical protein ACJMK2_025358 [Sinanodonta woodiana]|uniref:OTU domain-containing protein n=1 Tax=Sinanodonta woodiana TaxID=1069815 RepID=A0ABD3XGA6_SINWO